MKLIVYLKVNIMGSDQWIQSSGEETLLISPECIKDKWGRDAVKATEFAVRLYAILVSCTEERTRVVFPAA